MVQSVRGWGGGGGGLTNGIELGGRNISSKRRGWREIKENELTKEGDRTGRLWGLESTASNGRELLPVRRSGRR